MLRVETRGPKGPGGVGSGVVIAPDGLVLTNCHVVEGAKEVRLQDAEGRVMEARSLGVDPDTDLALLRALVTLPLAVPPVRLVTGGATGRELIAVLKDTGRLHLAYGIMLGIGLAVH